MGIFGLGTWYGELFWHQTRTEHELRLIADALRGAWLRTEQNCVSVLWKLNTDWCFDVHNLLRENPFGRHLGIFCKAPFGGSGMACPCALRAQCCDSEKHGRCKRCASHLEKGPSISVSHYCCGCIWILGKNSSWYQVSSMRYQVSGIRYQVLDGIKACR